jgi:hypothetical protein
VFGVETGFVYNVFYDETNETGSGVLRLIAQIGTASLGTARLHPSAMSEGADSSARNTGNFEYRANLRASYDLMLSSNDTVTETGGLGLGATFRGMVNPMGRFAFGFDEDFVRLIRAANFETDANTNRNINKLRLVLLYQPRDRAVSGYLYYENKIDIFERSQQSFADRMYNRIGLHPQWRVLPQTQAYLDVSIGNVTPLGDSAIKPESYPFVARGGIATLLSIKTTLNVDAGYANGFYVAGPSFSGPVIGSELGYRYSELGRAAVGYSLLYEDSINANYYRDHVIRGSLQHQFVPLLLMIQPEVHLRQYRGVTFGVPGITGPDTRDDVILSVIGGLHYNFRNWIAASVNYRFSTVQTDYMYTSGGVTDDPSFARHELLVGMRAAL